MPSRVRTLFRRKETFRATPATPSGRAVGSSCSTRLDQRLNSCGVKPSKFIFEFIPIPPLFGTFPVLRSFRKGREREPYPRHALSDNAVFDCWVRQKPKAKSQKPYCSN